MRNKKLSLTNIEDKCFVEKGVAAGATNVVRREKIEKARSTFRHKPSITTYICSNPKVSNGHFTTKMCQKHGTF